MARDLFSSTDADASGGIDQSELEAALASRPGGGQGPDAAELFATLDADGDGLVTEQEHEDGLASLHKDLALAGSMTELGMSLESSSLADALFAETDADGDGAITAEELAAAVEVANADQGGSVDAAELFAALDADGDGVVTSSEHAAGFEDMRARQEGPPLDGMGMPPAPPEGGGQRAFDAADANQDGVVDATELEAAVAERNEATGGDVDAEEVFGALDGDGDGVISAQEFARRGEASQDGGRTESVSPSRVLAASRYEMYRLMGLDAMASGQGTGFSATA
jgi:Ca2+-binding EF-hand superfamily protein